MGFGKFFENIFGTGRYNARLHGDFGTKTQTSLFLGRVAETVQDVHLDIDQLCKHTVIAGITGGGKTNAGHVIVEEAVHSGVSVIIVDPTLQWTGILRENNDAALRQCFDNFKMRIGDAQGLPTRIIRVKSREDVPRGTDVKTVLAHSSASATVVLVNELSAADLDAYICALTDAVRATCRDESRHTRLLILFDEVHCILPKYGGTGDGFTALERATREFREKGVGLLLISQVLEDFIGSIRANINTEVQMRTTFDEDLSKARLKYGGPIADSIMRAMTGTGLFHNAELNEGSPFFLTFRPPYHNPNRLPQKDLDEYFALDARIAELSKRVTGDQAQDLQLASESLRRGKFNTVKSYLENFSK